MKDKIVKCFYCDGDHETGHSCPQVTTGIKCECGGTIVVLTGAGGYQKADASRGMPMIEGEEVRCNDCGRSWWE